MKDKALENRGRIVDLWNRADLALINGSQAQDLETDVDDPDAPYLTIRSYKDGMGHTSGVDFTEENLAAAEFEGYDSVIVPGVIERINIRFNLEFYSAIREEERSTSPTPYEVLKCLLLDIQGLLEAFDENIVETKREGLRDSIDESIVCIRQRCGGDQWLHENFAGLGQDGT